MKNFVNPGVTITVPSSPATVASGDGLLTGVMFGVAAFAAASGAPVEVNVLGVFTLPKASGALTVGAVVYWDNSAKNVTATSTSNTKIGVAVSAQASGDTTVQVRLSGQY